MKLQSYISGQWVDGEAEGIELFNAVNGDPLCRVNSDGIDFGDALRHARQQGGPALRRILADHTAGICADHGCVGRGKDR